MLAFEFVNKTRRLLCVHFNRWLFSISIPMLIPMLIAENWILILGKCGAYGRTQHFLCSVDTLEYGYSYSLQSIDILRCTSLVPI